MLPILWFVVKHLFCYVPEEHFVWHDYLESTNSDEVPQTSFLHVSFIKLLILTVLPCVIVHI